MLSEEGRKARDAIMATHVKVDPSKTERDVVLRYCVDGHMAPGLAWQLAAQGRRIILVNDELKAFVGRWGEVLRLELQRPTVVDRLWERGMYARYLAPDAPERGQWRHYCEVCKELFVVTDLGQTKCEEHRLR